MGTPNAPSVANNASTLARLPVEVLNHNLPNSDLKNVQLVATFLRNPARLRFDRVFLSANPRDVDVLRGVADNDIFRKTVK